MTATTTRLKKIKAGEYTSPDGRYRLTCREVKGRGYCERYWDCEDSQGPQDARTRYCTVFESLDHARLCFGAGIDPRDKVAVSKLLRWA